MGVNLASFKNSRISPTPATTAATQLELVVPANTFVGTLTPVVPANVHRTYLTIYNRSTTSSFKYLNYTGLGPVPTVAQILANGFEIIAGAAYEVDSPEAVFAVSTTAATVNVDTDEGVD